MAQQYPVQGFLRINAPYPAFLSDYASPYSNKLNLSLTLTDLTLPDCRVRLRFTIARQNGVVARNADFLQSGESVIILSGGIPHTLTSTELAPYFRPENLQGLSPDAYSSQLPEGMYTFSVEVFDYFTGRKLSASIGQMLWIMLSEPPLLEEPANKARLADFMEPASTGNIIFRWTSRSAIAAYTEYTFTLCEIWDEQGDPYRQFLASIPKYQTTTPATTLLYGPADPPLLPGKLYAWRVQAKAKEGLETVGLYRQNGESEIRLFRYGSNCPKMTDYRVEVKSDTRIYLSWTAPLNALPGTGYKVAWHKIDPPGKWPWHEAPATTDNYYYLNDLKPGSDYELKVGVVCPEGQQSGAEPEVIYGNIQRTTTLPQGKTAGVECGRTPPPVDLSNQTLIDELKVGDAVMAADCEHVITKLSGDKNGWSGECYVEEPMLGGIRLKMTFKNIRVNTDKRMIAGAFYSVYNPNAPSIINAGKTIDEAKTLVENAVGSATSVVNSATDLTKGGTATGAAVTGNSAANYQTDFVITEVEASKFTPNTNNGSGGTLNFGGGKSLKVDTVPTTIKDAEGNLFAVDKTGKISQVGVVAGANLLANADFSSLDMDKGRVEFTPAEGMKYAFDPWQKAYAANSDWDKRYEKLTSAGTGEYRVAAKAVVPGATDKVKAIITLNDKTLSSDSIRFVTRKGVVLTCDKNKVITLVGGPADDAQEVFAIYPQAGGKPLVLGKLLVASYNSMTIDVDLVPVNDANANAQAIADALNKVYQPIGVSFRVNLKPEFSYDALTDKGLMVEGSGLLSAYTDQMKALNSAYASTAHYSPDHLVLFALKQGAGKDGNTTILGDMPRAQQFGYIFTKGQSGKEQGLVAAHEVGHGLFQLRHTFDYSGIKQGALPDNLMDYSAGNQLSKLQWDLIHDPGLVFGLFETDKGVQFVNSSYNNNPIYINANKYNYEILKDKTDNIKAKLKPIWSKLTEEEKLIVDLPLIEWKLGFKYGAVCIVHWLEGSKTSLKFPYDFFTSVEYLKGIDVENIKKRFKNTRYISIDNLGYTPSDPETVFLYNTSINSINKAYLKAKENLKKVDDFGINTPKGTDIADNTVSYNLVESFSIGDPYGKFDEVGVALGRFSQKVYITGGVRKNENQPTYLLSIDNFETRFTDIFTFDDSGIWEEYIRSQELGCWSKDVNNASVSKLYYPYSNKICLQNNDFIKLKNKAKEIGMVIGGDFMIYSDVKTIKNDFLNEEIIVFP
jgi:hypothetical protein